MGVPVVGVITRRVPDADPDYFAWFVLAPFNGHQRRECEVAIHESWLQPADEPLGCRCCGSLDCIEPPRGDRS